MLEAFRQETEDKKDEALIIGSNGHRKEASAKTSSSLQWLRGAGTQRVFMTRAAVLLE